MNKYWILIIFIVVIAYNLTTEKLRAETFISKTIYDWQSDQNVNNQQLEKQAQQLYESGRFTEAILLLQQAITKYKEQGNSLDQAMAFRNLALVYQQLGEWELANQSITNSLNLLSQINTSREQQRLIAQTLDVQGQIELSLGQSEKALNTWKQATIIYQQNGNITKLIRSQINQSQALRSLGLYAQANKTLNQIQENLNNKPDSLLKHQALQSIGDVLLALGQWKQSESVLEESLAIAKKLESPSAIAQTLFSLGNSARLQQKPQTALDFYRRTIQASTSSEIQLQAQLNLLSLLVEQKQWSEVEDLLPVIKNHLQQLSPNRTAIYARTNLANSLIKTEGESVGRENLLENSELRIENSSELLATAIQLANQLGDKRAESYALGNLGHLYEKHQRWHEAQELTEKALLIAQAINAPDLAYQWQWQLGRLLNKQGKRQDAIAAYTQAVTTLKTLRGDLVAISSDIQFSFRESVEPVYRELVSLLLQPQPNPKEFNQKDGVCLQTKNQNKETLLSPASCLLPSQDNLKQAREVIESLQVAELDNFFRDACLDIKPVQIDQIDPTAAIFYTIILGDRLEVIVAISGQPLRHYSTNLAQQDIEETLQEIRTTITSSPLSSFFNRFLASSQQVYNWLIRPIEADLAHNKVKTLVFVLDGALRNISPASLHDGKQYLVEKYSIALVPSLQLLDPQPIASQRIQLLAAGVSQATQDFSPLPNVESELEGIEVEIPTQVLLNQSFTESNFQTTLENSSTQVVHLATHGQFSSQAEDTFILTWDNRININEFNSLLRADQKQKQPIELLVLSACQTASGDNRAALGLAGVAVRAGARSTVASLWSVNDRATALLMIRFYQELSKGNVTKAEALRRAQQSILQQEELSHPYFWSAFVLLGNWF